jgi:N-acyl-D-amino-acid deacylase
MSEQANTTFDITILNGSVLKPDCDGFHNVNIGINYDRIASVTVEEISGNRTIDAKGLTVSPGFVDIHTHVDEHPYAGVCEARMGVTTSIGNNCGMGIYPPEKFREQVERDGFPINQGLLVGHQNLRETLGCMDRYEPLDSSKLDDLSRLAEESLDAGAFGVSFGLAYVPGASADELKTLAAVVAERKSILTAHPRYAALGLPGFMPDAIEGQTELILAARESGARIQISHLGSQIAWKADPYDDLLLRGLESIEKARDEGIDIMADCHPYDAWCTNVGAATVDAFQLEAFREHYDVDFDVMQVAEGPYCGQKLNEQLYNKLREESPNTLVIGHMMKEDLVARTFGPPFVMVASDSAFAEETGFPTHPRCCSTFPRALRLLVHEFKLMSLEEALYKMTLLPADRFGLERKGRIEAGADADIVIFDPEEISDLATYMEPDKDNRGIVHVLVNGISLIENGNHTDTRPGRFLSRDR